ncbi:MAG: PAS domain S-box protein [Candidatus Kuenenia sp.]|nr:PAS domain S-box protein [Candidatus Kuenenia hertensis]
MQINLNQLSVIEILKLSEFIKEKCCALSCLENAAQEITKILYESFTTDSGKRPFALVRFFSTDSYNTLPEDIQTYIQYKEQRKIQSSEDRYLTLLGTYGDREEWRSRKDSKDCQAFSLSDPHFYSKFPMLSAVFRQIGIERISGPQLDTGILVKEQHKRLSSFCVEDAVESKFIPKQSEFVKPFAIQSVFGFGGIYPAGSAYVMIIFSKEKISKENSSVFLSLNPAVKQITLPYKIEGRSFTNGVHKPLSAEKNSKEESLINIKRFNEKVVDNHKKYLIEKEMSAAIRAELEIVNDHMIALAEDLKRSNKNLEEEIIKRKQIEAKLEKSNELLEQCIADRTRKLEEQNLKLVKESKERRKMESALRESEKRFRVMFEQAAVGVALREIKTDKFVLANKKYCDIVGYTMNEITKKTLIQIVHPDDLRLELDNKQKLIDGEIHEFTMEKRYFHKNGYIVWVNLTVSPIWKIGEYPDFYLAIVEDITERKRAIESLLESNEKIQLLLNSTGEGIYGVDAVGVCTFVNAACMKMLGYESADQLIGKQMHNLIHHSYRDGTPFPIEECKILLALQKGEGIHVVDDIVWRANGTYFPAEYMSYPIKKNNEILGAVITFQDITERKRMEEELLHSKKMQALGVITSGVAHEINNILAAIDGNIQILIRQNKGRDKLLGTLHLVHKYVKDGAEIVRRLNEFTKEKKDVTQYVMVDLAELTNHVVEFLKPKWLDMAQGGGIKFNINTDGLKKVGKIKGNPSELREVVMNIVNNALDAMPKGGTLCILTWEDEDTIYLSISDTGTGMSEDVKLKIFDPFFTNKKRGTGLGLSVAYGIIKRHGGRINVSSTVGMGSTFLLSFPSSKDDCEEETVEKTEGKKGMRGNKILVVEDEVVIGKVLYNFLSEEGYAVEHIDDGKEALDRLKVEKYDLVLCDLGMPEVSGWDIMQAIETLDEKPKVGVITGFLNTADSFPDKEIKANFVVNKPFDLEDVLDRIQSILEK